MVLHIGLHKTGTTSIQSYLREHERELADRGMRFPKGWLQRNCHFELPIALLRQYRLTPSREKGVEWKDADWCADVVRQVARYLDAHRGERTILSCEEFSFFRYDDEFTRLRAIVGDPEIILFRRDVDAWLASLCAEQHKIGFGFSENPDAYNCVERRAWIADHEAREMLWRRWFSKVTVYDYDELVARDGTVLPQFCEHLGVPFHEDVWLNRTGTVDEGRVPGTRWSGGRFGIDGAGRVDTGAYLASARPS